MRELNDPRRTFHGLNNDVRALTHTGRDGVREYRYYHRCGLLCSYVSHDKELWGDVRALGHTETPAGCVRSLTVRAPGHCGGHDPELAHAANSDPHTA